MTRPTVRLEENRAEPDSQILLHWAVARHWISKHGMAAAIILCVAVSSVIHLCNKSMWYDEAVTMLTVSGHAKTDFSLGMKQFKPQGNLRKITVDLYQQDVHPPLYFWMLALWRVAFGPSLEIARALSALFVVATCLLLYRLARDSGMRWPWIPVALYAAAGVSVQYAWNARPYALASFLILLTHLLAQKGSRWTGICAAASIATHYFAALCVVPILLLIALENWKIDRSWVKQTAVSFVIGVAPLLWLLRIHLEARPYQYSFFGPLHREVWALCKWAIADALPNSELPGWEIALAIAAAFFLAGTVWAWKRRGYLVPVAYFGFLCGFLLLALVTNKSIAKMPVNYYLGIAAPWLAMLVGFGVNAHPRWSPLLGVAIAAGMMTAMPFVKSTDYRVLAAKIKTECSACAVVVGNGYAGAVPACILYESGGMNVIAINTGDNPQTIANRAGDQQPVVFVKTNEPPTADMEEQFLRAYPSVSKDGYFEVFTAAVTKPRTGSAEAKRTAAPIPMGTSRRR